MMYGDKKSLNLAEIKKGFARGGHYHPYEQFHVIISGKVDYREEDIKTKDEKTQIITGPKVFKVQPNAAHLLIALEDTLFFESFDGKYIATDYQKYRTIVESKMMI